MTTALLPATYDVVWTLVSAGVLGPVAAGLVLALRLRGRSAR